MGQAALAADGERLTVTAGAAAAPAADERRIVALDGVRGLMTILVILSHYFGELPNGVRGLMFGWIAVDMFFVLSGLLIGKLVLEKRRHANFFAVFYARRVFRLCPVYILAVLATFALIETIDRPWVDADVRFPLWSYLTFTQTFFMVGSSSIGAHWLAPTWTLALEEHFYLVVPALLVFAPRRWLVPVLMAGIVGALALRIAIYGFGFANEMAALTMLPARADLLLCGVLGAVALTNPSVPWARYDTALRVAPLLALLAVFALKLWGGRLFDIWNPLLLAIGCAAFLLSIVRGAPEAARFRSRGLRFFGDNSYCLYLTHLPILGLAHGLVLGAKPDIATPAQLLVTLAALPVCVLVGWGLTRAIEEPLTRYGRTWRWSAQLRQRSGAQQVLPGGSTDRQPSTAS